jgi:hypothetical protein
VARCVKVRGAYSNHGHLNFKRQFIVINSMGNYYVLVLRIRWLNVRFHNGTKNLKGILEVKREKRFMILMR